MKRKLAMIFAGLFLAVGGALAQTAVNGTVVSHDDGEPVIGATVRVVGADNVGAVTDVNGRFSLTMPAGKNRLSVSYVGMATQEVTVKGNHVDVALYSAGSELDEVMVIAYGTAKRSAFTGSASVVKSDELEDRLVSNVTNALSGSVAGVQVIGYNGQPGETATVRIRGVGSINAGMNPLYVVDGVPFDGDLSSISVTDIESMTVLKDAAAAALYGARGANGVILITTKKGKSGDTKITVDTRWGANSREIKNYDVISDPGQYLELMYQAQYNAAYYHIAGYQGDAAKSHAYANSNIFNNLGYQMYTVPNGQYLIGTNGKLNPNATLGYSDGTYYYTPDNWEDGTYRSGLRQEYNVSVSGGSDKFTYFVSGSYLDDQGVISNSSFDRFTGRANLEYQATNWLKVGTNTTYTYYRSQYPDEQTADSSNSSGNAFALAYNIAPVYPMYVRNADGSLAYDANTGRVVYDYGDGSSTNNTRAYMSMSNPMGDLLYNTEEYLSDIMNTKWFATLTPIEGLNITGTLGYFLDNTRYHYFGNSYYGQTAAYGGEAEQYDMRTRATNIQALANYTKTFAGKHNTDFLLGYESYDYDYEYLYGYGYDTYQDGVWAVGNTLSGDRSTSGASTSYATRGIFGRANYDYDNIYYGSVSYRRDASSRFAPGHRWGNFWSASAAWVISKEKFMKNVKWVDMLKFKVSFGQQGNDNIGNYYAYLDQYSISGATSWSDGTLYYKGNEDLTWETSNSFNIGFDFSLFKNKLSGTIEYFNRQTSDMLYNKPTATSLGYSSIPMNVGSMRNNGVEIELNYKAMQTKNVDWDVWVNATAIGNKILKLDESLGGEMISGSRIYREGDSMYQYYLVHYAGVNPENGAALFSAIGQSAYDSDGEYQGLSVDYQGNEVAEGVEYLTESYSDAYDTDRKACGSNLPKVYGGIGTNLKLYGFDFSISCAYQLGGQIYDDGYQSLMGSGTSSEYGSNWHKDILNAWTPENTNTNIPKLDASASSSLYSNTCDFFMTSSNYFAINNITLGYTLPSKITRKWWIESLRFYGSADNVAIFSARKGMDPRMSYTIATSSTYSAMRSISGGIKIVF
ncbi:MAG: TonB-dependent receptor [Prevotella sp.]|nr:TonB-dependent receptor [Prevotella sp.]